MGVSSSAIALAAASGVRVASGIPRDLSACVHAQAGAALSRPKRVWICLPVLFDPDTDPDPDADGYISLVRNAVQDRLDSLEKT